MGENNGQRTVSRIGGRNCAVETLPADDQPGRREYVAAIVARRGDGTLVEETVTVVADVDQPPSVETIVTAVRDWDVDHPDLELTAFEVFEQRHIATGEIQGLIPPFEDSADDDTGELLPDIEPGDRVAYQVRPENPVYGHVTEGIVEAVPPWDRSDGTQETRQIKLRVGDDRTTLVDVDHLLGPTSDPKIAEQIDRRREELPADDDH